MLRDLLVLTCADIVHLDGIVTTRRKKVLAQLCVSSDSDGHRDTAEKSEFELNVARFVVKLTVDQSRSSTGA